MSGLTRLRQLTLTAGRVDGLLLPASVTSLGLTTSETFPELDAPAGAFGAQLIAMPEGSRSDTLRSAFALVGDTHAARRRRCSSLLCAADGPAQTCPERHTCSVHNQLARMQLPEVLPPHKEKLPWAMPLHLHCALGASMGVHS